MSPEEIEKMRWVFAGQIYATARLHAAKARAIFCSVEEADLLISALQKTAPKDCDHHFVFKAIDSDKPHAFLCNERDGAVMVAENVMRLCTRCLAVTRIKEGDLRENI